MFLTRLFILVIIPTPAQSIHHSPCFLIAHAFIFLFVSLFSVHVFLILNTPFVACCLSHASLPLCLYFNIYFHPCPVCSPQRCKMPMRGVMRFGKPFLLSQQSITEMLNIEPFYKKKNYPAFSFDPVALCKRVKVWKGDFITYLRLNQISRDCDDFIIIVPFTLKLTAMLKFPVIYLTVLLNEAKLLSSSTTPLPSPAHHPHHPVPAS